ncbi:MAG: dCTP deaminase [Patescibacteria group bacterium]
MILSDSTLKKMIDSGKLITKDKKLKAHINPASVDLHLGNHYLTIEDRQMSFITLDKPIKYREIESQSIIIPSHGFLLASTKEYVKLPANITAFVEGRSSIGRIGLFVQNAGWIDPGFEGNITLELYNANSLPIKLKSGRRICQIVFSKIDKKAKNPYRGKYQGQVKSVGSRVYQDNEVS